MRRVITILTFALALLLPMRAAASIAAVYIAQSNAGAADGSSCANAEALTFFNTSANWGAGSSQIGSDTIVHLCGATVVTAGSTALTFQGSGTSGHPITLLFEAGASISAPYCSITAGCVNVASKSFIVVDGGTNGSITNTANGTGLANAQDSIAIECGTTHDIVIKNLAITNIYQRTQGTSGTTGGNSRGIDLISTGNNLITKNTIANVRFGVHYTWSSAISGDEFSWNTISGIDNAFLVANNANANNTGPSFHDNTMNDMFQWDEPSDSFHHEFIHFFEGGVAGHTVNALVYNNFFGGNLGSTTCSGGGGCVTAEVFVEDRQDTPYIFNDIFCPSAGYADNALLTIKAAQNANVFNNVFCSTSTHTTNGVQYESGTEAWYGTAHATGGAVFNSVFYGQIDSALYINSASEETGFTANTNDFNAGTFVWGGATVNFATWKTDCGCDGSSVTTAPNLTGTWHPNSGSPVIGLGTDLTATCASVTALCLDAAGDARPNGSAWDAGAYQFSASASSGGKPLLNIIRRNLPIEAVCVVWPPLYWRTRRRR